MPELPPSQERFGVRDLHARLSIGRVSPLTAAVAVAGVLATAAALWWLLHSPASPVEASLPRAVGAAPTTVAIGSRAGADPTTLPHGQALVVQVAGAVVTPGVYRLAAGARVVELIETAGGPTGDADVQALPLATVLHDGDRIWVPKLGEAASGIAVGTPNPARAGTAGAAPTGGASAVPSVPIDLNRATAAELDALPGVGPATAAAIVAYRDQHGAFVSVDELLDVRGIGPAKLEAMRASVRV